MRRGVPLPLLIAVALPLGRSAGPKPRFVDVTAASGLTIAANTGVGGTNPHAVAVEDFDGDGLPDILITTFGAPHVRYFRGRGGLRFADATKARRWKHLKATAPGLPSPTSTATAAQRTHCCQRHWERRGMKLGIS